PAIRVALVGEPAARERVVREDNDQLALTLAVEAVECSGDLRLAEPELAVVVLAGREQRGVEPDDAHPEAAARVHGVDPEEAAARRRERPGEVEVRLLPGDEVVRFPGEGLVEVFTAVAEVPHQAGSVTIARTWVHVVVARDDVDALRVDVGLPRDLVE